MIKVVSFKICPFVQRVTAALAAKNIAFEVEYISLKDKPQWFLDISPNGQVPVLITEADTALFESDAIIEYIEDEYGSLELDVTNEQRALDRAWSYLGTKHYLAQCSTMRSQDEQTFVERCGKLHKAFAKVEKQLSAQAKASKGNKFFKSDSISNVDIAWLPLLHRAHIVKQATGHDLLCCLPKVQQWQQNLLESGLIEQTVADDFVEKFSDFYLSNTYIAENAPSCSDSCYEMCGEMCSEECCSDDCCKDDCCKDDCCKDDCCKDDCCKDDCCSEQVKADCCPTTPTSTKGSCC
ncbi:glutathione S-transferase family protein [Shewanella sp. WXL01]|nr:glutathione S-transferase family protein [Shewanella sp. WXL01]NKF49052.1 glutathione S-transferase family protein [Shewanella sp. WXL01]